MSLVVVGTVAFDALETPYGKTDKIVGGAATYISISANNYIKPVKIVSVVGEDYDMDMLAELKSRGIEQEGLQIKKVLLPNYVRFDKLVYFFGKFFLIPALRLV